MHQYNVGAPFERIAIDVAGPPWSDQGNRNLLDYFTKWPEAYAISNQEASTEDEALVTKVCRFGVSQELHSNQGSNFESCLIQEVLQRLGVSKASTTLMHPQSDAMGERYIKTFAEHL
jgi:hypothetical protein